MFTCQLVLTPPKGGTQFCDSVRNTALIGLLADLPMKLTQLLCVATNGTRCGAYSVGDALTRPLLNLTKDSSLPTNITSSCSSLGAWVRKRTSSLHHWLAIPILPQKDLITLFQARPTLGHFSAHPALHTTTKHRYSFCFPLDLTALLGLGDKSQRIKKG